MSVRGDDKWPRHWAAEAEASDDPIRFIDEQVPEQFRAWVRLYLHVNTSVDMINPDDWV